MTVKEIIKEYLIKNNYDGLYYPGECACKLSDLFPCCLPESILDCKPGYKMSCPDDCDKHDFHIGEIK